jgi:cob(I)alamin adenosyltransferase
MPRKVKRINELGLIHVYTGDGKGKTTAALGLALRALGHRYKVCIIQFMKGGRYYGELVSAEKHFPRNFEFAQFGQSCPYADKMRRGLIKCGRCRACFLTFEEETEQAEKALAYAEKAIKSGKYDLVILDEINVVLNKKQINIDDVLRLMMSKPKNVELILTGRRAPPAIIAAADYVTEMRKLKHPFDKKNRKALARRGIEY